MHFDCFDNSLFPVQIISQDQELLAGPIRVFATLNGWFHRLTGVHMWVYTVTDWLGLVPILICVCFGCLGLYQLVKRKSLKKVDSDIILLGIYYILVIFGYLIFEVVHINYRPVLIEGALEASYPSSVTGYYWTCNDSNRKWLK